MDIGKSRRGRGKKRGRDETRVMTLSLNVESKTRYRFNPSIVERRRKIITSESERKN